MQEDRLEALERPKLEEVLGRGMDTDVDTYMLQAKRKKVGRLLNQYLRKQNPELAKHFSFKKGEGE